MNYRFNAKILLIVLAVLSAISLVVCIGIGPVRIAPETIFRIVTAQMPGLKEKVAVTWTPTEANILLTARIPRVLLGFCVGCALAFSGSSMQTLVKNELADPFILGVSYGAAAFAAVGLVTGIFASLGVYQNLVNGLIGAIVSLFFVFLYSLNHGKVNIDQLLLGGVAISLFMRAFVKIIALLNPQAFYQNSTSFWTSGGLATARWEYLKWPIVVLLCCMVYLVVHYRALNVFLCGTETAHTLGIDVEKTEKALILTTSLMIGVTVAVSGGIGFIGLVAPHVARMLVGGDHKRVFPVSALLGGIFVLWCDVLARMAFAPQEISVGIFTALIGGPCFILLLKRQRS